ncbi:MAG TPA: type VI secretion system tube protein Hcp [Myxococcaceae bacterium]|nr:type VI secretion system tube protein Hcp [Myxococcaceae bacterium]
MKTTFASTVLGLVLASGSAALAHDKDKDDFRAGPFFITIDGVTGESQVPGHEGTIEGFNFSETWRNAGTTAGSAGGGASAPTLGPVVFDKVQGPATLKLLANLVTGHTFSQVVIEFDKKGSDGKPVKYYQITLRDVLVSGVSEKSTGNGSLVDEVQLSFASGKWEVFDPADSVSFDSKTNKAGLTAPPAGRNTR